MKRSTVLARSAFPWRLFARRTCTGLTALWCPVHGDCRCPRHDDGGFDALDDDRCPLHARASAHPIDGRSEVAATPSDQVTP